MKPILTGALSALLVTGSIAAVGYAWKRTSTTPVERESLTASAESNYRATHRPAPKAVIAEELIEAPLLDDVVLEEAEFNTVIGIGGGAGGKFGGRYGGRRNLRSAGGRAVEGHGGELYHDVDEPGFRDPRAHPYSTFSVDVDTASYANIRRFLNDGTLPPPDAVRVEEILNSFEYRYPSPTGEHPLAIFTETASCPWNPNHRLLSVALQAARVDPADRKPLNLVFLIDVSGSMKSSAKLPLVVDGLKLLTEQLDERDTIAIVTYANGVRVPLMPTPGHHTDGILAVLDSLRAQGSTNGEGGIQQAYTLAQQSTRPGAESRVILATDGDFNVGMSSHDDLVALIEEKAKAGVTLTVLGFGRGNLKDATLEQLADRGDGNYGYIDTLAEAKKLFGDGLAGTLVTAAKDVKLQIELNPIEVAGYRLVGYANRRLADEDFKDDAKDAGDVGVGHSVTALYEIIPTTLVGMQEGIGGIEAGLDGDPAIDPTRYQTERSLSGVAYEGELATVKVRYKRPGGTESIPFETVVRDTGGDWTHASLDFRFAAAAAMFGEALSESPHRGEGTLARAQLILLATTRDDPKGERTALLDLTRKARELGAL